MAGEDRAYTDWIRQQDCAACLGPGPCEAHHHTHGETFVPGERPPKAIGGKRGKGQKAHDYYTLPLHFRCHGELHRGRGRFKDMTPEERRAWQTEQVNLHRARYEAYRERHPLSEARSKPVKTTKGSAGDAVSIANRERIACAQWFRDRAGERRLSPEVFQELSDRADELEAITEPLSLSPS